MKKIFTIIVFTVMLILPFSVTLPVGAISSTGVDLGSAENFVILSETGITNTGSHTTKIVGDIGSGAITAAAMNTIFCSEITGKIYGVDAGYVGSGDATCFAGSSADKTIVDNAVLDMETAYTTIAGKTLPDGTELYAGDLSGQTITAGLYKWSSNVVINSDVTLSGSANDVWIFQIAGDLNIASAGSVPNGIKVLLSGGAKASNIFWQVGGLTGATLGTYSTFNGSILTAKQIVIETGAVLNGKALAQTQVTLDANNINTVGIDPMVLLGTLSSEDFGVVNYDSGLGILKGYTAGFGVIDNTFIGATQVVVKLYAAGDVLLQTNTAILPKFNAGIMGSQFSSPFDVSGTFNYATDGYWANTKESQYGQSIPAIKVVATVTLANGKVVTATNINMTGDATTIYPTGIFTLNYTAGDHGVIIGINTQTVNIGLNGTLVKAEANNGYHFTNWSDLVTTPSRTDLNVQANINVNANFVRDSSSGGGSGGSMPTNHVIPTIPANHIIPADCLTGVKFSPSTGRNCNAATPATPAISNGKVLGIEHFNFTKYMRKGSKGNEVMEFQKFLTSAGYECGTLDGNFGPKTKNSAIKFQLENGLVGDGIVGYATRTSLNK